MLLLTHKIGAYFFKLCQAKLAAEEYFSSIKLRCVTPAKKNIFKVNHFEWKKIIHDILHKDKEKSQ